MIVCLVMVRFGMSGGFLGWLDVLVAPVVNVRTGMKQVGFEGRGDPCSCQIHGNGHFIIWPRCRMSNQIFINGSNSCDQVH